MADDPHLSGLPPAAARANPKWADLRLRAISAGILAPVALLALWAGGAAWVIMLGVALVGLGWEWAQLAKVPAAQLLLPAALLLVMAMTLIFGWPAGLLVMAVLTSLLSWRYGRFLALGLPYAGLGGIALLMLRLNPPHGLVDTLFLVALIWATDIGAYAVGRIMGGPKLAPKISPGKTISGSVGGLICAAVAAMLIAGPSGGVILLALALSICAQAGDLLESAIKRTVGVKDSGRTIPGHGGLFDRLDGFLAAAPLAAILAFGFHGGLPIWQ